MQVGVILAIIAGVLDVEVWDIYAEKDDLLVF